MAKYSAVEWTDSSWNPWYGCRKLSPGCQHCYAERDMSRFGKAFTTVTRAAAADHNAAVNIAARAAVMRPMVPDAQNSAQCQGQATPL